MKEQAILRVLNVALAAMDLLETFGINYREVAEAKERARAAGRDDLNDEERRGFLSQSQAALDRV